MIELLRLQLALAREMRRVASSPGERAAWGRYHDAIRDRLEDLLRPPRRDIGIDGPIPRP